MHTHVRHPLCDVGLRLTPTDPPPLAAVAFPFPLPCREKPEPPTPGPVVVPPVDLNAGGGPEVLFQQLLVGEQMQRTVRTYSHKYIAIHV